MGDDRDWFVFDSPLSNSLSNWFQELDPASYASGLRNVDTNGMQDHISVEKAEGDGKIFFPLQDGEDR
jgi:hypothetical protein